MEQYIYIMYMGASKFVQPVTNIPLQGNNDIVYRFPDMERKYIYYISVYGCMYIHMYTHRM